MFKHPLGLEWGTVGGEEGWLDPRVKGIKKLLPRNMGAKEERKIFKEISQKQAKERHSKRWFVGDKTVKGTKPDLTPVKNVGGKKGMRSLLQKRTKDLAWEKGWSQLNPDQIADLMGSGVVKGNDGSFSLDLSKTPDRVTNKVAQQLMRADELAVQKALGQPLSPEAQKLNQRVTLNQDLAQTVPISEAQRRRNARRGIPSSREITADQAEDIVAPTAPKVNIEGLTPREEFALGQVRGSVAKNKARAKQIYIDQQKELLGKNISVGTEVGGNTAGAIEKKKPEIEKKPEITRKDIPKAEPPKIEPPKKDPPKNDVTPPTKLEGWDKAANVTNKLGLPHPAVMIAKAIAFLANPDAGNVAHAVQNQKANLSQDFQIDDDQWKFMA